MSDDDIFDDISIGQKITVSDMVTERENRLQGMYMSLTHLADVLQIPLEWNDDTDVVGAYRLGLKDMPQVKLDLKVVGSIYFKKDRDVLLMVKVSNEMYFLAVKGDNNTTLFVINALKLDTGLRPKAGRRVSFRGFFNLSQVVNLYYEGISLVYIQDDGLTTWEQVPLEDIVC